MAVEYVGMDKAVKMNYAQLQKIVTTAAREARKRSERIFKSKKIVGSESPAIRRAQESRPRGQVSLFESRGKNRNQLLAEYKRIKEFMQDPTSTVAGTKSFYKDITKKMQDRFEQIEQEQQTQQEKQDHKWNEFDTIKMLKTLNKLKKENAWVTNIQFKYEVMNMIRDNIMENPDISPDDLLSKAESMLDDVYMQVLDSYYQQSANGGNQGDQNAGVDNEYMNVIEEDKEEWSPFI